MLNPELVKGPWTPEEDRRIVALVKEHGPKKWSVIADHLPGRIGKQCRYDKTHFAILLSSHLSLSLSLFIRSKK